MAEATQSMRDHWWWRPGWRVGRSLYTWHVMFDDQPAVHRLAADYAPVLNGLPTLDQVPVRWLHLTMQGIGFTYEVDRADVAAIANAARDPLRHIGTVHDHPRPHPPRPEALLLVVRPAEPVNRLRATIRAAIADVWGPDNVPEDADDLRPHFPLAYSNAAGPAEPIIRRLGAQSVTAAEITVHRAALIDLKPRPRGLRMDRIIAADLSTPATPGSFGATSAGSSA